MKKFEPHFRLVRVGFASKIEKASRQQRTYCPRFVGARFGWEKDFTRRETGSFYGGIWSIQLTFLREQANSARTDRRRSAERRRSRVRRRRRRNKRLDWRCVFPSLLFGSTSRASWLGHSCGFVQIQPKNCIFASDNRDGTIHLNDGQSWRRDGWASMILLSAISIQYRNCMLWQQVLDCTNIS